MPIDQLTWVREYLSREGLKLYELSYLQVEPPQTGSILLSSAHRGYWFPLSGELPAGMILRSENRVLRVGPESNPNLIPLLDFEGQLQIIWPPIANPSRLDFLRVIPLENEPFPC